MTIEKLEVSSESRGREWWEEMREDYRDFQKSM